MRLAVVALLLVLVLAGSRPRVAGGIGFEPTAPVPGESTPLDDAVPLRCVALGTAIGEAEGTVFAYADAPLIDTALDIIKDGLGFDCVMVYTLAGASDYILHAAAARQMKVIGIIALELDEPWNDAVTADGIDAARAFDGTLIRLSCGSELRLFYGDAAVSVIRRCLERVRAAGIVQPLTSIDTWWEWCNRSWPCEASSLAADVDWIGINIFPWWENLDSVLFPCTTAADAVDFHVARLHDVSSVSGATEVIVTEFGWPAGPDGYTVTNRHTGAQCGVASEANQRHVIAETLRRLDELGLPGVIFQGFRGADERARSEGPFAGFWGLCEGIPPYRCNLP